MIRWLSHIGVIMHLEAADSLTDTLPEKAVSILQAEQMAREG